MPILAGIVIALILIGFFALPVLMPSPMGGGGGGGGGRPRQGEGGDGPPPEAPGQPGASQGQAPTAQQ